MTSTNELHHRQTVQIKSHQNKDSLAHLVFHMFHMVVATMLTERRDRRHIQFVRIVVSLVVCVIALFSFDGLVPDVQAGWHLLDMRICLGEDGQDEGGRLVGIEGRWHNEVFARIERDKLHHLACVHERLRLSHGWAATEEIGWELPLEGLVL